MINTFGIVIIPNKEVRQHACTINKVFGGSLELTTTIGPNVPHMTLFQGAVDGEDEERSLDSLRECCDKIQRLINENRGWDMLSTKCNEWGGRFIFWDMHQVTKRDWMPFHLQVASVFVRHAPHTMTPVTEGQGVTLSDRERVNVKQFCYPFVAADFRPHITVAFDGKAELCGTDLLPRTVCYALSESVALVRTGPFGSVAEVLYHVLCR